MPSRWHDPSRLSSGPGGSSTSGRASRWASRCRSSSRPWPRARCASRTRARPRGSSTPRRSWSSSGRRCRCSCRIPTGSRCDAVKEVVLEIPDPRGPAQRLAAGSGGELVVRWPDLRKDALTPEGGLRGCLACGHPELYTRRAFPATLGLGIVVVAAGLAPWTSYLSLAAAGLLDFVLYLLTSAMVVCYVCGTRHRGFPEPPRHPRYDLGIAERLRHGPKAVMGKPMRPGGTAGAPDPEH